VLEFPLSDLIISNLMYESSTEKILEMIKKLDDDLKSVMIFGHNPDFTDLVNHFIRTPIDNVPTSGAVSLKFNSATWKGIDRSNLEQHVLSFPSKDE